MQKGDDDRPSSDSQESPEKAGDRSENHKLKGIE